MFCQSNPVTFFRPRCLNSNIIIIRKIIQVQCLWTRDLLFCEQRPCDPHVPYLGVVIWGNLGGGRGGGGTFRFCLRLQQPSFHLSRRRNQNAVFSRSKSYASDSMYDYFDSDSVAKEKGASLQFTVNSVMYMLTCDQGVVLPFFVNLSGRRKKLPPDRKLCTFIQET